MYAKALSSLILRTDKREPHNMLIVSSGLNYGILGHEQDL